MARRRDSSGDVWLMVWFALVVATVVLGAVLLL